jgi:hypothetical protein
LPFRSVRSRRRKPSAPRWPLAPTGASWWSKKASSRWASPRC